MRGQVEPALLTFDICTQWYLPHITSQIISIFRLCFSALIWPSSNLFFLSTIIFLWMQFHVLMGIQLPPSQISSPCQTFPACSAGIFTLWQILDLITFWTILITQPHVWSLLILWCHCGSSSIRLTADDERKFSHTFEDVASALSAFVYLQLTITTQYIDYICR